MFTMLFARGICKGFMQRYEKKMSNLAIVYEKMDEGTILGSSKKLSFERSSEKR